ncbi:zinc-binding dehydrogenase [Streptomyces rochei]|uniref:zinc-binding dehydrogenase n=1 Tax=Streptomyces rochei TaxID=1928 RepID=UPI0036A5FFB9
MIPVGARLTSYAGQATDLPADVFARQLPAIAEGRLRFPVAKVYRGLEEVRDAHADIESGTILGKHIVVLED